MGAKSTTLKTKMAICLVVFNPARTKRILMNYLYTRNQFLLQGLPVFTVELVYEGRPPEIPDALHVTSNSYMFHKENLYRVLEPTIPRKYTKLAFIDCDVIFKDPTWYETTSKLLKTHDIVQPFEVAHWMDITYKSISLSRKSVLLNPKKTWDYMYHPGFAWCMRRDWYKKVGFFDYAVSGSGDTLSSIAWMRHETPKPFHSLPASLRKEYGAFKDHDPPRMTYLKGSHLFHLYHGSRADRQYVDRHKLLNVPTDIADLTTKTKEGVLQWVDPDKWNPFFLTYFRSRNDDDVDVDPAPPRPAPQLSS
jgi:hypothetical protein